MFTLSFLLCSLGFPILLFWNLVCGIICRFPLPQKIIELLKARELGGNWSIGFTKLIPQNLLVKDLLMMGRKVCTLWALFHRTSRSSQWCLRNLLQNSMWFCHKLLWFFYIFCGSALHCIPFRVVVKVGALVVVRALLQLLSDQSALIGQRLLR